MVFRETLNAGGRYSDPTCIIFTSNGGTMVNTSMPIYLRLQFIFCFKRKFMQEKKDLLLNENIKELEISDGTIG